MKKVVKKWGDSLVVLISKEEAKIYKLIKGSIIDIDIRSVMEARNDKTE